MLKQIHPGVIAAILTLLAIASATFGIVAYTLQWSIPLAVLGLGLGVFFEFVLGTFDIFRGRIFSGFMTAIPIILWGLVIIDLLKK